MKKIKVLFIAISFFLFFNISLVYASSDFNLDKIEYSVNILKNGDMEVTENWQIDVKSITNTLFKTFKIDTSKYSEISDVQVYEVLENGELNPFTLKNKEVLHVDKNCFYNLVNSNGDFEIAWGINENKGKKSYKITYLVKDCIKKYNDISELYWQFIGSDFEIDVDKITGTINIPYEGEKTNIKAWAHGPLNGNIEIKSNDTVYFDLDYLDKGYYIEVRLALPNEIFSEIENTLEIDRLDTILTEEVGWAEDANRIREELRKKDENEKNFLKTIKTAGIGALAVNVFFSILSVLAIIKHPKVKPSQELKYYRELPNLSPSESGFIYFLKNSFPQKLSNVITAGILNLSLKGFVTFEVLPTAKNDKEKIKIVVNKKDDSSLLEDEKVIYSLLNTIRQDQPSFSMKQLEKFAKNNYEKFMKKLDKLVEVTEKQVEDKKLYSKKEQKKGLKWIFIDIIALFTLFFNIFCLEFNIGLVPVIGIVLSIVLLILGIVLSARYSGLTIEGADEREKLKGLKKYMQEFSLIKDKEVPELVLWEKYLVFGAVFGITDKVIKELKVKYPELTESSFSDGVFMHMMFTNGLNKGLVSTLNESVLNAYNTGISQRAGSNYGNTSSGVGLGGGFSGGGGFGGGRRWRRPEDKIKQEGSIFRTFFFYE